MKTIREAGAQTLTWAHPHVLQAAYELRAGAEVVATLSRRSLFGTLADAQAADGHWTFKRAGFLRPYVSVRADGSETDLAVFRPHWAGPGELVFPDGRRFGWAATNFWHSQWAWTDAAGAPLMHFKPRHWSAREAQVEIEAPAAVLPELSLLALLGWYLLVLSADDAGATGAMVATLAATGG